MQAAYVTKDAPPLADLSQRLAGQLLDSVIAYCPLILAAGAANETIGSTLAIPATSFFLLYILSADGLSKGQSWGKKAMKTAVVDATTGTPCTIGRSFVRNILMFLGIFDWAFIFGKKRQRLGDMAANTIVIKIQPD